MKKFVEVFLGSRGMLEEVNLIESDLSCKDYYDIKVSQILAEMEDVSEDEEDFEFMSEFVDVTEYDGFLMVGLNEEEYLVVFDFEENEEVCNKLLKFWEEGNEEGIRDIVDNLDY